MCKPKGHQRDAENLPRTSIPTVSDCHITFTCCFSSVSNLFRYTRSIPGTISPCTIANALPSCTYSIIPFQIETLHAAEEFFQILPQVKKIVSIPHTVSQSHTSFLPSPSLNFMFSPRGTHPKDNFLTCAAYSFPEQPPISSLWIFPLVPLF